MTGSFVLDTAERSGIDDRANTASRSPVTQTLRTRPVETAIAQGMAGASSIRDG